MVSEPRSFWQKAKKPLEVFSVIVVCALVIALVVVIVLAYIFKVNVPGLSGKNIWDWLQLLIIPAVLAIGGYLFNFATSRTEREIASDKQREDALQAYIDSMSALLLEKDLRKSGEDDEVRNIARVRTLTVLQRLDADRKGSVLQFIQESVLIARNKRFLDLRRADLSGANLKRVDLRSANLSETDLSGANLVDAYLYFADLSRANLKNADLSGAFLKGADLSGANLNEANLNEANLNEAILSFANLSGADLRGASLEVRSLKHANLKGTNLSGILVIPKQLDKAESLKGATMPDGTKHA